jgi:hypothetical protein
MKQLLLSTLALAMLSTAVAQCTADYDFQGQPFGVSPDPVLGESFEVAYLGAAYYDEIHIIVPTNATDVDPTLPSLPIDSVLLTSVNFVLNGVPFTSDQMGLTIQCNNNGDSPNSCTFFGGQQYCASLSGTPTVVGVFQMSIVVTGYVNLLGTPIAYPISFDQYVYTVVDPSSVAKVDGYSIQLGQNAPNPANDRTWIPFTSATPGKLQFTIVNLLGEVVYTQNISARAGSNEFQLDTSMLNNGIYMYSIQSGSKKLTKRLVINR